MKYLVTGASGLIGWQLVNRLAHEGHGVTAWLRRSDNLWPGAGVNVAVVDLLDRSATAAAMFAAAPDIMFHLSAQSQPARSWAEPIETMHANVDSTLCLLEAIKAATKKPRLLLAGSSAQYAARKDGSLIGEDTPFEPSSPYAVSKIAAEHCANLYARAFGMDTVLFRPFLWIGPRKTGDVASDVARRVVAIERGSTPVMPIGNIAAVRDFIDIQDGIDALLLLADKGKTGEAYNVCAGTGLSVGQLIDAFRAQSKVSFTLEPDPRLMRPIDEPVRVGDARKLQALGWQRRVALEETVRRILHYWRKQ
jgi:GDP-4-dehydro-6-deoxy-D-mannose reductase